jgi:hypothetical protein
MDGIGDLRGPIGREFFIPLEWGGGGVLLSMKGLSYMTLMTIFCGEELVSIWRSPMSFGEFLVRECRPPGHAQAVAVY